jgi:type I restriction enzyme M protein
VKTSILIVRKIRSTLLREKKMPISPFDEPLTRQVWFYEIESDGYTLGANRTPQYTAPNDLWDALKHWQRYQAGTEKEPDTTYYQPTIHRERWRLVDSKIIDLFPHVSERRDQVLALQELFPSLIETSSDLQQAEERIVEEAIAPLNDMTLRILAAQSFARSSIFQPGQATKPQRESALRRLKLQVNQANRDFNILEQREGAGSFAEEHGRALRDRAIQKLSDEILEETNISEKVWPHVTLNQWTKLREQTSIEPEEWQKVLKHFARFDGYDVYLRSPKVHEVPFPDDKIIEPKCWTAKVREWRENPDWISADDLVKGSHDDSGSVRPEYVQAAFDKKTGTLRPEFLDSECIEGNDFNISAGRYKPGATLVAQADRASAAELLREISDLEKVIHTQLKTLLAVVEAPCETT